MAQICCAGASCICVMFVLMLTVNTEYCSLNKFLDFLHYGTTNEYSRHFMLLYPTVCAWATW